MNSSGKTMQHLKINGHQNKLEEGSDLSYGSNGTPSFRVAHTLTSKRKTRCDAGLPRCGPCERSNENCEYFDTSKGRRVSRNYVIHLQNKVQTLEAEIARIGEHQQFCPDAESMVRGAGRVKFKENDESRYLGPSSGIAITRLVMELAKQNTNSKSIKEVVPDVKARQIKDRFTKESSKPTSKIYPLISDVAAPDLPSRELAEGLVDNFNRKAQYMLPTLHEPSFHKVVEDVYGGSGDAYKNFTLRMVIAISMQKLDTRYAGLADSYYLAALPYLEDSIRPMNLETLQCFALVAQYSLVTPTRTAAYWVVGLATRLCQELGITEEEKITFMDRDYMYNALEIDMRRRLFWIITSMEYGLAHSLGRPSAFGTGPDRIDVRFFEAVDDQYITSSGVLPGSPLSIKKLIAIHFFKMRLLQAEIRRKLYLKKRPSPRNDQDSWFKSMELKLNEWRSSVPQNDEGSGLSETWFEGRLNTMLVFLHRPSPQIPVPSVRSAKVAYKASIFNIQMQRDQIAYKSVDLTWIFTQSLFMALNTVLWALSYSEIREEHPRHTIETVLFMAQEAIHLASERWPGVESALELYDYLTMACLKVYDRDSVASYKTGSPSNRPSPMSSQDATTPPPMSSPSTIVSSISSTRNDYNLIHTSPFSLAADSDQDYLNSCSPLKSESAISDSHHVRSYQHPQQKPAFQFTTSLEETLFDPASFHNPFPSTLPGLQHWSAPGPTPPGAAYAIPQHDPEFYLGSIGEQYSQYLHTPFITQQPLPTLSEEQQIELMKNLESNGLQTTTSLLNDSATFFTNPSYMI